MESNTNNSTPNPSDIPFDHDPVVSREDFERDSSNMEYELPYRLGAEGLAPLVFSPTTGEELEVYGRAIGMLYNGKPSQRTPGAAAFSVTLEQAMATALYLTPYPDAATNPKAFTPERMRLLLLAFDMQLPKEPDGKRRYGITLSWTSWREIIVSIVSLEVPMNWNSLLRAFGQAGVTVDYGEEAIDVIRFYWPRPLPSSSDVLK